MKTISDMPPLDLKVLMLKAGVTQAEIARRTGVTIQSVNHIVNGRFVSNKIRAAISEAIDVDLRVIWPTTYLYDGKPRKRGRPTFEEAEKRAEALRVAI